MAAEDDKNGSLAKWKKAISVPFTDGNRVDYLIDGQDAFDAMHDAIMTTFHKNDNTYYIYLLGWYLDIDLKMKEKGFSINELFTKASREFNVQVRVILWDAIVTADHNKNTSAVTQINLLSNGGAILDNNTLDNNLLFPKVGSHHQKVLIVKGQQGLIGFCGGVDINSDRIQDKGNGSPLHDVHCRIQGNGARSLLEVFIQRWQAHPDHGRIDMEPDTYQYTKYPFSSVSEAYQGEPFDQNKGPLIALNDTKPVPGEKAKGRQYVAIARTFNFVSKSTKCAKERSIKKSLIGAIRAAIHFIYIEDQYLWNFDAAAELGKRLKVLQYVIIIIPHTDQVKQWPSNPDGGEWAHFHFMEVIKLHCEHDDYSKIKIFHRVTPGTDKLGKNTYVHAKCWIFDDELAVIGSANCNRRGWETDSEVIALIFDEKNPADKSSFAQMLRMQLWSKNLGIPAKDLFNWMKGNELWPKFGDKPKEGCGVTSYDIAYDYQLVNKQPKAVNMDEIDPGDGGLAPCGDTPTVV